jgi:tRNA (uracil-5-)-methyltransferase TRM9
MSNEGSATASTAVGGGGLIAPCGQPVGKLDVAKAEEFEEEHVHGVYNVISSHFSHTRYKPWPQVVAFLESLDDGSWVADVGCGNGKYIGVNPRLIYAGSDRSIGLAECCRTNGHEVCVADNLRLPYRAGSFDAAISIAVVHHLSSEERRVEAVREILRILRPGGRMLMYNWAFEQTGRRKGFTEQDNLIPWHLQKAFKKEPQGHGQVVKEKNCVVYKRFYHMFVEGESERLIELAGGCRLEKSYYDQENWCVIAVKL